MSGFVGRRVSAGGCVHLIVKLYACASMVIVIFFLMIRRPPRSTLDRSSAASDVYKRQGQFSVRGGIVDIFSYGNDNPYRIELFGDTVESIRRFDPQDQLSVERLAQAVIVPDLQDEDAADQQLFFSQLPKDAVIWYNNSKVISDAATHRMKRLEEAYAKLTEKEKHAAPSQLVASDSALVKGLLGFRKVTWGETKQDAVRISFAQKPQPPFAKDFKVLSGDLHLKQNAGFTNLIACSNAKQSERLFSIFQDMEHEVAFTPLVLDLHEGFIDDSLKIALYTDHQIFERYHRFRLKEGFRKNSQALTLKELTQLKPGDLVVHIDHGVGIFSGLETIDAGGSMQDCLLYTSDAAGERSSVDLGGGRIIKKKKIKKEA